MYFWNRSATWKGQKSLVEFLDEETLIEKVVQVANTSTSMTSPPQSSKDKPPILVGAFIVQSWSLPPQEHDIFDVYQQTWGF